MSSNAKVEGRRMLEKACTLGSALGCTNLGKALYNGAGGDTDKPRAIKLWTDACTAAEASACHAQGDALSDDDPHLTAAETAFRQACEGGKKEGCSEVERVKRRREEQGSGTRKSGTLSAESMTVDGLTLRGLSCDLANGGALGVLGIAAGLRERKTQLDACIAKGGPETHLVLHAKNGRFAAVEVTGQSATINRCVERALLNQRAAFDGKCSLTIVK